MLWRKRNFHFTSIMGGISVSSENSLITFAKKSIHNNKKTDILWDTVDTLL